MKLAAPKPNVSLTIASPLFDIWLCSPWAPDWSFVFFRSHRSEVNRILISSHHTMAGKYGPTSWSVKTQLSQECLSRGLLSLRTSLISDTKFPSSCFPSTYFVRSTAFCFYVVVSAPQLTLYPQKYTTWKVRANPLFWLIHFTNLRW